MARRTSVKAWTGAGNAGAYRPGGMPCPAAPISSSWVQRSPAVQQQHTLPSAHLWHLGGSGVGGGGRLGGADAGGAGGWAGGAGEVKPAAASRGQGQHEARLPVYWPGNAAAAWRPVHSPRGAPRGRLTPAPGPVRPYRLVTTCWRSRVAIRCAGGARAGRDGRNAPWTGAAGASTRRQRPALLCKSCCAAPSSLPSRADLTHVLESAHLQSSSAPRGAQGDLPGWPRPRRWRRWSR